MSLETYNHQRFAVVGTNKSPFQKLQLKPSEGESNLGRFKKQGNYASLVSRAFLITPKNLDCTVNNPHQDALDLSALRIKEAAFMGGKDNIVAVHKVRGWAMGILKYGHASKTNDIYAYTLQHRRDGPMYDIIYIFSKNRLDLLDAGLLFANPKAAIYASPPTWFRRLQAWLNKPSQPRWCNLLLALRRAHFQASDINYLAKKSFLAKKYPACQAP